MKRSGFLKRTPFRYHGRKAEDRVTKGGRVILNGPHYTGLCFEVWTRDEHRCVLCFRSLQEFSTRLIDHIVKRSSASDNPGDTLENMRTLCFRCHDVADNQGGKLLERKNAPSVLG